MFAKRRTAALLASAALALAGSALAGPDPGAAATAAPATEAIQWTTVAVAPGVTVRNGTLDDTASHPTWTVTVDATATSALTGLSTVAELGTARWAQATAARLTAAGYQPRLTTVDWPDFTDTPHGVEGVRVRVGSFATQADATAAATALHAAGFPTATVEWTGFDVDQPADAQHIHVAIVDPAKFRGTVGTTHDGAIVQRETTSSIAAKLGAVVAVNGGFFVTADADGFQGVPSGLAAYDGELEAESSGSRAALVIENGTPSIRNLTSSVTVRDGAASHSVEGVNRKPGVVRDCGRPDSLPTTQPRQDITCTSTDEIVLFTPEFGAALPAGAGTQALLDPHGEVVSVGARGGSVPAGDSALQAIGSSATWLARHAIVGRRLAVTEDIRDRSGRPVRLTAGDGIASAAPVLVRDGRVAIDAATEGVLDTRDLSFNYSWVEQRQPRTMAGIDARGRLILVTVDGRQPGVSEGETLAEGAALMRSLGAVQAMNLDGGGSTAMAVRGVLVNHPSDATGERPIGDAVVILPSRH
jgi:exopolysaccharide biosynthesis protein